MAQVLMGYDATGSILRFDEDGNLLDGGGKVNNVFFLNFSRLLVKDEIKKGTSKSVNNAKSLNITSADGLNPTQLLRKKLQTLKSGIVDGGIQLKSVPGDLKAIGEQAKSLISSAKELPKAAKSLGMKAPKALKNIKNTTDILTKIPTEVTSIGNETKKVLDEIDQVLKNIENILNG